MCHLSAGMTLSLPVSMHQREYDRNSDIGHLDKALDEANEKGWTVVDMKNDWRRIFPFE
jgi:hypothetical protein